MLENGVFDGRQYAGYVLDFGEGKYLACISEVPQPGEAPRFLDATMQMFTDENEASEFVKREWEKRFGDKTQD